MYVSSDIFNWPQEWGMWPVSITSVCCKFSHLDVPSVLSLSKHEHHNHWYHFVSFQETLRRFRFWSCGCITMSVWSIDHLHDYALSHAEDSNFNSLCCGNIKCYTGVISMPFCVNSVPLWNWLAAWPAFLSSYLCP